MSIAVVMGSESDRRIMQKCVDVLEDEKMPHNVMVMSAHRQPTEVAQFARTARDCGYKVIIAGAGLSAALPGVIAAHTTLPVIGVPIKAGALNGVDALYSIVQMPPGVPVGSMGIDGAKNAALYAIRILSL